MADQNPPPKIDWLANPVTGVVPAVPIDPRPGQAEHARLLKILGHTPGDGKK